MIRGREMLIWPAIIVPFSDGKSPSFVVLREFHKKELIRRASNYQHRESERPEVLRSSRKF